MANLIYDSGSIASAVTQVDIDLTSTPIEKGELYELVFTLAKNPTGVAVISIFANDNTTQTNYWLETLGVNGTSINANRLNTAQILVSQTTKGSYSKSYIKLTNDGKYILINEDIRYYDSTAPESVSNYVTSTFTMTNITKLNFVSTLANGIGVNSRIQLYKVAEKVDEIIVSGSPVTQVDFTTDIQKGNEYLLVSDGNNTTGTSIGYSLYYNDNVTATNYYYQRIQADNANVAGLRINNAHIIALTNATKSIAITNIKLPNSGIPQSQGSVIREYDGTVLKLLKYSTSATFTVTNIDKLSIVGDTANSIGIGSRFELYKLI